MGSRGRAPERRRVRPEGLLVIVSGILKRFGTEEKEVPGVVAHTCQS